MRERKGLGMKGGTPDQVCLGGTVEDITQQGETQCVGMNPNLVGAPGGRNCRKERIAVESLQNMEICLGWFPFAMINDRSMTMSHVSV